MIEKDRRKQLLEQFKEIKTYMGAVQIKNLKNGKIFVAVYPNLKNKWYTLCMQLNGGKHMNGALQADWTALGEVAFEYTILEQMPDDDVKDKPYKLRQLERKWHETLQPYGERGYNKPLK